MPSITAPTTIHMTNPITCDAIANGSANVPVSSLSMSNR
jgi:hypothetical protein